MGEQKPFQTPPKSADRLLAWFCKPIILDYIQGDLYEQFQLEVESKGKQKANFWYWRQVLGLFRPFAIKPMLLGSGLLLFKTHARFTFRQMKLHPLDACFNVGSLSVGIACLLFAALFVRSEFQWDRFHKEHKSIRRVVIDFVFQEGERIPDATTPPALSSALKEHIPEVLASCRLFPSWGSRYLVELDSNTKYYEEGILRTDSTFFKVFDFPIVQSIGKPTFQNPNEGMVTQKLARKYFGNSDPLGKTIHINLNSEKIPIKIVGVFKDIPLESHFHFDLLIPLSFATGLDSWGWYNYYTYVKLHPESDLRAFEEKLQPVYDENQTVEKNRNHIMYSQALSDIHLKSNLKWELEANGNIKTVIMVGSLGAFILLISLINYLNLALSNGYRRHREIGLRKVLGVKKGALLGQFMVEAFFVVLLSFIIGLILALLFSNQSAEILGREISILKPENLWFLLLIFLGVLVISLAATTFPAVQLSSIKILDVLDGNLGPRKVSVQAIRGGLVVIQFSISIFMIISAWVVKDQINLFRKADLGLDADEVVVIPNANSLQNQDSFINELRSIPGIVQVGKSNGVLGKINWTTNLWAEGPILVNYAVINPEFLEALGLELVHGELFNPKLNSQSNGWNMVVNEETYKSLNLIPEQIGTRIPIFQGRDSMEHGKVIGVVKNFQFTDFKRETKPFAFFWRESEMPYLNVRLQSKDAGEVLQRIEERWDSMKSGVDLEYFFLDQSFAELFESEQKLSRVLGILTFLALFIAFIGMFAMAHLWLKGKLKEVAVRKVLGAKIIAIIILLTRPFLILFFIANSLAWAGAYYAMNEWLSGFVIKTNLSLLPFAFAGLVSLFIAAGTVGLQSLRLAIQNPVQFLRKE